MNDLSNVSLWVDEVKKCKGGGQEMFLQEESYLKIEFNLFKNEFKLYFNLNHL